MNKSTSFIISLLLFMLSIPTSVIGESYDESFFNAMEWRSIGP